jgi:hypothetical protein
MATTTAAQGFDDRNIKWSRLGEGEIFDYLLVHALSVDEERNIVDFLGKFEPNKKIVLHRHLGHTNTFVVDGDHILYEPDTNEVREVRPVGRHTESPAGDVHTEGGGDAGTIVYYSVRAESDALFELLDEDRNVLVTLRSGDVKALLDAQKASA